MRHHEMQLIPGPGHRDIDQPPLLLDILDRAGAEIGRDAAIDRIQDEDRLPFLALAEWMVERIR